MSIPLLPLNRSNMNLDATTCVPVGRSPTIDIPKLKTSSKTANKKRKTAVWMVVEKKQHEGLHTALNTVVPASVNMRDVRNVHKDVPDFVSAMEVEDAVNMRGALKEPGTDIFALSMVVGEGAT
eukprot:CAMPEP_0204635058 /NCGR_PEP_ID=MMETSP0717-20131115/30669_1 /ASSEMBLY_ACC=CAM_ASM_000666 /TAXON_ID=230516 /ORGANISM="Chaetoceros curvisetus" /LENGTH=123 /DNA_ID=CAMNT_0051653685 /DNA_START=59 /DNA_END=431 /DNA_ORIENTATION=+